MTFFDLEDAFGSVPHDLIQLTLKRFHIPSEVEKYITSLYSNISGTVVTKSWRSEPFHFRKGVYQGDPLSPIIFLIAFNPILEVLQNMKQKGYMLNKDTKIICTPFADDFNLITTHKKMHQNLMDVIHSNTTRMGLKLKPSKCRTFSIVSGKPSPVIFSLNGSPLETIENDPHKFLGHNITFSGKQSETFAFINQYFCERLERIEKLLIRGEYKIEIYKKYLLPASRFLLTVHELSKTNLTKLDALTHRYLKLWAGLPRCAATEVFHLPIFLDIPSVTQTYLQSHTTAYASSRIKADTTVQAALDSKLEREAKWLHKFSVAQYTDTHFERLPHDNIDDLPKQLIEQRKLSKQT